MSQQGCKLIDITGADFRFAISPELLNIGVCKLGLTARRSGASAQEKRRLNNTEHYKNIRDNHGLIDLMFVYIGCVQIVVGTLTARRVDELMALMPDTCLDETKRWLIFKNAKSTRNLEGIRLKEARPIDPIAVAMIKVLVRLQRVLKRYDVIKDFKPLFSTPSLLGELRLKLCGPYSYNLNLDYFCDYFETSRNSLGQRYYLRQHPLRRFFAMLFFYKYSFGGVGTLRWMLGHVDVKHLWNYITESIDGSVLRSAKSQFVAENLYRNDLKYFSGLAELIRVRFGIDDFSVVETSELDAHITSLVHEGRIKIDPEFIEDGKGQKMRVMVKITELD